MPGTLATAIPAVNSKRMTDMMFVIAARYMLSTNVVAASAAGPNGSVIGSSSGSGVAVADRVVVLGLLPRRRDRGPQSARHVVELVVQRVEICTKVVQAPAVSHGQRKPE